MLASIMDWALGWNTGLFVMEIIRSLCVQNLDDGFQRESRRIQSVSDRLFICRLGNESGRQG